MEVCLRNGAGWIPTLLLVATLTVLSTAPASAGPGVRISHSSVVIDQPQFRGSTYELPDLKVTNPGDIPVRYEMKAVATETAAAKIPPTWLLLYPGTFHLDPGESRTVEGVLAIPEDAPLGDYAGLLAVQLVSEDSSGSGTGARLGAAAATLLSFEVSSRTMLERWLGTASTIWTASGIWGWVSTGFLVVGAVVAWVRRHYRFSFERR